MKVCLLGVALVSVLAVTAAFCQEPEQLEAREQEMQLRGMELKLAEHESELEMKRQMGQLELEKQKMDLERARKLPRPPQVCGPCQKGCMVPFLIVCFVIHILVAVWIYQDIRARNCGSGIWIVVGLLAGLLGALVYAVVRLGDNKQAKNSK
jgi:Flp pilus assembly protein TadB